jgi:halogenation protein CepH
MPLLEEIGVLGSVSKGSFIRKWGGIFIWGNTQPRFLPMPRPFYAFQVERARFDDILLRHAEKKGAHVRFGWRVNSFLKDPTGRLTAVIAKNHTGQCNQFFCRFVVDASGLTRAGSRLLGLPIERHGPIRAAISAYFENARRYLAPNDGDVISESSENGWLWFIPLSKNLTSVGLVTDRDLVTTGDLLGNLMTQISTTRVVKSLTREAKLTSSPRLLGYSNYLVSARLWTNGLILVGDSAGFVDPLFSTGVHCAMYGAVSAGAALISVLRGEIEESEAADWYDGELRRHYEGVRSMVELLYSLNAKQGDFWTRRDLSKITRAQAEEFCHRLGPGGFRFFEAISTTLPLPAPIQERLAEFNFQVSPSKVDSSTVLEIPSAVVIKSCLCRRGGKLHRGVSLNRQRHRTSYPVRGPEGALVMAIDGQRRLGEIIEHIATDEEQTAQLYKFAEALAAAGWAAPGSVDAPSR